MNMIESVHIEKDIDTVFKAFTNLDTAKRALGGILYLQILEGDQKMAVGTRWKETRKMMGQESSEVMWVTDLESPHSYSVEAESHGTKYLTTYSFKQTEDGTKVTWEFSGIPQTFVAKMFGILGFLFSGSVKKMMQKDLEDLKLYIEKG